MTTIVVHGTMTIAAARHSRWWWDSWGPGGFLRAVRTGMEDAGSACDLWRIGGRLVSGIPELQPRWSLWTGRIGQFPQHLGYFVWDGADMGVSRLAGSEQLARYLNVLHELGGGEPLRVIAHSHGCNVVKLASTLKKLSPAVKIERAVFLACPHLEPAGANRTRFTYPLNPRRFGGILNLYSTSDTVQTAIAETLPGMPSPRFVEWEGFVADRVDHDPAASRLYQDREVATTDTGIDAHTAMHGAVVGYLCGRWLAAGGDFGRIVAGLEPPLPPVPRGDFGEGD